jgi:hypothetical protein
MTFVPESVDLHGSFRVALPVDRAFPLFSPRGEEVWVPGWKPEILHPAGATWEEGLVFRTYDDGVDVVWFVAKLDHAAHRVTYHRVERGRAAVTVTVACDAVDASSTEVKVRYVFVGISDDGNAQIRALTQEAFAGKMQKWGEMIAAAPL